MFTPAGNCGTQNNFPSILQSMEGKCLNLPILQFEQRALNFYKRASRGRTTEGRSPLASKARQGRIPHNFDFHRKELLVLLVTKVQKKNYILISIFTPAGNSKWVRLSIVLSVGEIMSISLLWTLISK